MSSYQKLVHDLPEYSTIGQLLNRPDAGKLIIDISAKDLMEFIPEDSTLSNIDLFKFSRNDSVIDDLVSANKYEDIPIEVGDELRVPFENLNRETLFTIADNVSKLRDTKTFLGKELEKLMLDPSNKVRISSKNQSQGVFEKSFPDITVWLWSRALGDDEEGQFIDISPFVMSCNTSSAESGGTFNITLPPLMAEKVDGKWDIKKRTILNYTTNNYSRASHLAKSVFNELKNGELKRSSFFFHNIISQNDLIFIRYEVLQSEKTKRIRELNTFYVDKNLVPGNIYDMIGLVDSNQITTNAESNDVMINIQGRDLTKLIIDDGSYFFPLEFAQGVFLNVDQTSRAQSKLLKRNLADGKLISLNAYLERTIEFSLQFVINQLSNTGLVPNSLFSAYQKRNTKFFPDDSNSSKVKEAKDNKTFDLVFEEEEVKNKLDEIYNKYEIYIGAVSYSRLDTNSKTKFINIKFATLNSNLVYELSILENQLVKQNKAKETLVKADVVILKSRFEKYNKILNKRIPKENAVVGEMDGLWQIIDLQIDQSVANRRIVDSSIAEEQGSIINTINKFCQKPFVEFLTDTHGDRFTFIVRKVPFDREGFLSYISADFNQSSTDFEEGEAVWTGKTTIEDEIELQALLPSFIISAEEQNPITAVIDIEEQDVLSDSLSYYDDSEVYSWYQLTPQAYLWGSEQSMTLAFLPAIYFEEYSKVFGSRPYKLVTNYVPFQSINDKNTKSRQNFLERQIIQDLAYLIESHSYLPFARRGTIVINGNRTIKKGTFIRYKPTSEIYYVKEVTQDFSITDTKIDRTTTVTLERGLIEKYIKGVEVNDKIYSYFNIIDTNVTDRFFNNNLTLSDEAFKFDRDMFYYFLRRRQLS